MNMTQDKKARWKVFIGGILCGGLLSIALYYSVKFVQWIIWAHKFIEANI